MVDIVLNLPLGRACGKCDTSKGRTNKVRGRLTLVKLKV